MKMLVLAMAVVTLAAGCAAPEANTEQAAREPDYRTGSNIPRKKEGVNRVETINKEELERSRGYILNLPVPDPK